MAAESETGFMIDGRLYPVPDLGTFTMDEAQILFDYSSLGLEDFATPKEDATEEELEARRRRLRNPGFYRALMHIAYARGNPKEKPATIRAMIGAANVMASFEFVNDGEEEDALPPAETSARGG